MTILLNGIMLGLVLSVLAGPIFFTLIQHGLEQGFRAGAVLAAGQWFSDSLIIIAVWLGAGFIAELPNFKLYVGVAGGIMLLGFGLSLFLTKPKPIAPNQELKASTLFANFTKGFLINSINPFPILFWLSISLQGASENFTRTQYLIQFGSILGTVVVTDLLKIFLAKKIRPYLQANTLWRVRQVAGVALMIFGLVLIYRVTLGA